MTQAYYRKTPQQALEAQNASAEGLSAQEARRRAEQYGPNKLSEGKKKSTLQVFLEQFKDLMVLILIIAAVISAFSGNVESTIVIFAVLVLNAILGTVQYEKAEKSLESLKAMASPTAKVMRGGVRVEIPSADVVPGDIVISGCVNEEGILRIETTTLYDDSTVAKILDLVENSSLKKAPIENFITKFARYYTPAVCIGALVLAFVPPLFLGNWLDWIMRALTFLVISCPCALVISIPLTFFGGIGGASKCGILVKGGNYLEALSKTSIAVFDKTGTLTKGVFKVTQVIPINGKAYDLQMMEYAALAESVSNHPIAKSIQRACPDLDPRRVTEAKEIAGQGVKAKVDGHWVLAGNKKLMDAENVNMYQNGEGDGKFGTVVYIAVDGKFRGLLVISDEVKPTSKQAIIQLIVQGVHTVMLTGDSPRVGEYVAKELGVQEVHGGLLPADKVEWVEKLLAAKRPRTELAFVGDGINDAPVLMRADIGIAMGALGSDAAIEAADIVLMDDDPAKISLAMRISRKCMRITYENIVFALAVKAACLVLTALGITNMWWGVFADVGVMVLAVLNAIRALMVKKL